MAQTPITTKTVNDASPELLRSEIDSRIIKIRPMATPVDQISRHARSRHAGSMTVEFYAAEAKPFSTTLSAAVAERATPTPQALNITVANAEAFAPTETIMFDIAADDGKSFTAYISAVQNSTLTIHPTSLNDAGNFYIPAMAKDTKVIRMGRAARELDVQTPIFQSIPIKDSNYCQIFKSQIEQSTIVKLANKEVGWTFSDQEEAAIIDMRQGMERNFLFGSKARLTIPGQSDEVMLTGGIWHQAGRQATYSRDSIAEDELLRICRTAFTGNSGSSRKLLIGGTGFIEQLHMLGAQRVLTASEKTTRWGLDFQEYISKFGTLYILASETFDECGHADDALIIDPEYLTKYSHIPFSAEKLNLRSSGQRNTDAIVITEASCLVLRYPDAHLRIVAQ